MECQGAIGGITGLAADGELRFDPTLRVGGVGRFWRLAAVVEDRGVLRQQVGARHTNRGERDRLEERGLAVAVLGHDEREGARDPFVREVEDLVAEQAEVGQPKPPEGDGERCRRVVGRRRRGEKRRTARVATRVSHLGGSLTKSARRGGGPTPPSQVGRTLSRFARPPNTSATLRGATLPPSPESAGRPRPASPPPGCRPTGGARPAAGRA